MVAQYFPPQGVPRRLGNSFLGLDGLLYEPRLKVFEAIADAASTDADERWSGPDSSPMLERRLAKTEKVSRFFCSHQSCKNHSNDIRCCFQQTRPARMISLLWAVVRTWRLPEALGASPPSSLAVTDARVSNPICEVEPEFQVLHQEI